jgi:hypothetical protein
MNAKVFQKDVKSLAPDLKAYKTMPVLLGDMRAAPPGCGQRTHLSTSHVNYLVANLDINAIGQFILNHRDGIYWVCDGQHRIAALRKFGFGEDYAFPCRVYEDLTDKEMATMFLKLNRSKAVDTFSKFLNAVSAGYKPECDVKRVVEGCDLHISRERSDKHVGAVAACLKVYHGQGEEILGRALTDLRDGFEGNPHAFDRDMIQGTGLLLGRYNGKVKDAKLIEAMGLQRQGVSGVLKLAEQTRARLGSTRILCIAATLVDVYNKGLKPSEKVPTWWKEDN